MWCRMTKGERVAYQNEKGLGHLYSAFQDHKDGLEACAAVEALIEISAIETLRSSFLLPLQGDAVSAEVRPADFNEHATQLMWCPTAATPEASAEASSL